MCADDKILLTPLAFGAKNLKEYKEACEQAEADGKQQNEERMSVAAMRVAAMKVKEEENDKKEKKTKKPQFRNNKPKFDGICNWCAVKGHKESQCWSKKRGEPRNDIRGSYEVNFTCFGCGEKGHMAKNCMSKKKVKKKKNIIDIKRKKFINNYQEERMMNIEKERNKDNNKDNKNILGVCKINVIKETNKMKMNNESLLTVNMKIEGIINKILIDTGATTEMVEERE